MKFFIKDLFSDFDQIRSFLRIWPHIRKKSLMKNYIFCAVKNSKSSMNSIEDAPARVSKEENV